MHLEEGSVHVTQNFCTHEFALLSEGWFEDCEIECPLHEGRFDVCTGKALCSPLKQNLRLYSARVRDGIIWLIFLLKWDHKVAQVATSMRRGGFKGQKIIGEEPFAPYER